MKAKLRVLYNTLLTVETKGESTVVMADCIKFLQELINNIPDETKNEVVTKEKEE